jgi:hypothetical protein
MPARFKVAIAAILIAAFFIGYAGWSYLARIDSAAQRSTCSDRLIGYAFDAAARTLSAPPAPNPLRMATATDFLKAADRLTDADAVCDRTNNKPKPLPDTPVEENNG